VSLDRPSLAARIQEILKSGRKPAAAGRAGAFPGTGEDAGPRTGEDAGPTDEEAAFARRCAADAAAAAVRDALGGCVVHGPEGSCLVVERCYDGGHTHGREPVARYAEAMREGGEAFALLQPDGGPAPAAFFFDLETTGLSGGAGTYAFLVGCGWFEGSAFVTRQYFLRGFGEERGLLHAVKDFIQQFPEPSPLPPARRQPTVVTYNGRTFDVPVMETRFLMHRLASPFDGLAHLDLLFPARRLWRRRLARAGSDRRALLAGALVEHGDPASCALTVLEEDILGLMREGDVPGWEIPGRYFAYARTGDPTALEAVLEHNRLDLVSLGALTARVLEMLGGRRDAGDRYELLALARLHDFLGRPADAERCYRGASAPDGLFESALDATARAEALHWLALHHRHARRFPDAAVCWSELLALPGLDPRLRREALEALAVHHEHRARDLTAARRFALRALDLAPSGRPHEQLAHRLGRLGRKLATAAGPAPADPAAGAQADMFTPPTSSAT
jgi:uncharacterized protein YprB with RNaseH-like and TPR domain